MGATGGRVDARLVAFVVLVLVGAGLVLTGSPASAAPVESVAVVARGIEDPAGLVQGPDGNLWFPNRGNDAIGRATPTGTVTLFAGVGIDRPADIVVGPDGALWFTNTGNGSVGRITTSGAVTNFPIPGDVNLRGIASGPDGNLWVTEDTSNTVVRLTPAGATTAFPSNASSPGPIVAGPDGALWFTSHDDNAIVTMTVTGVTTLRSSGSTYRPTDITVGPDGNLWVVNSLAPTFGRMTTAGVLTSFQGPPVLTPTAIAAGADGNLWFVLAGSVLGSISMTGTLTDYPSVASGNDVQAIAPRPGGALWYLNWQTLGSFSSSGTPTERVLGTRLSSPRSIVSGPDGNFWFINEGTRSVGRTTPTGVATSFTVPGAQYLAELAVGPDGNLWFTDVSRGAVGRVTPAGVVTVFTVPNASGTRAITGGPDGVWFSVSLGLGDAIGRIDPTGVITIVAGPNLTYIGDLTTGPDGNVWFTSPQLDKISRITPAGVVTPFAVPAGTAPGQSEGPSALETGPDGNLWFVGGTRIIGRMSTSGQVTMFPGTDDMYIDGGFVAGPDGAMWFTQFPNRTIDRITMDGTYSSFTDPNIKGGANALAVGPDGNLWFSTDRSTIGKVTLTPTAPVAPGFIRATGGYAQATVTWGPASSTGGGSPITGYTVTSSPGDKTCSTTGATSCVVGGLTNGTAYTFTVKATNAQGTSPASTPSTPITVFEGSTFHPMTPVRILDSRGAKGGWNGTKLTSTTPRPLAGAGANGVPSSATALVMNVTVVDSDSQSFLTVYPNGTSKPTASNLNFDPGQIVPNLVTVKVGTVGAVQFATSNGSTHVVADIVGYYDDGIATTGGAAFTPITPERLLDSRGPNGGWNSKLEVGAPRDLQVRAPGNPDGVPAGATALIANVTVTNADSQSYLTVWPSGVDQPEVSNLNFLPGQNIPNLVTIGIGSNGAIRFANNTGKVDVVVDVVGYFEPGVGARFFALAPTRVLDSRIGTGLDGTWKPLQTRALDIGGAPGTNVPEGATGIVANVTVTDGTAESLISVYPGNVGKPISSNLNFGAGQIVPNLVAVGLAPNGTINLYNDKGEVNLIADVVGFFAP